MTAPALGADQLPPASLPHARSLRDDLARLLARERTASAEFILALAEFDARRGWEPLGHASLFSFLHRELGLSKGAAYLRFSAARLLPRHPEVEAGLRSGRLCLSAVGELARVLTQENRAEVLPRFYGCSAREAREVAASLVPREAPPIRELVTRLPLVSLPRPAKPRADAMSSGPGEAEGAAATSPKEGGPAHAAQPGNGPGRGPCGGPGEGGEAGHSPAGGSGPNPNGGAQGRRTEGARDLSAAAIGDSVRAHELAKSNPGRDLAQLECEPLTADLRRLHLTVTRRLLAKLAAARDGLALALPGATTEQVLEAALDLLLEKQARGRRPVKVGRGLARPAGDAAAAEIRPGEARPGREADPLKAPPDDAAGPPASAAASTSVPAPVSLSGRGSTARGGSGMARRSARSARSARSDRAIPAAVRREVWHRDGGRCQYPLDSGGTCGSTARIELDHVVPVALGGQATLENLRLLCARHNRYAARLALGEAVMAAPHRRRRRGGAG